MAEDETTLTDNEIPEPMTDPEKFAAIVGKMFDDKLAPFSALLTTTLDTLLQIGAEQTQLRKDHNVLEAKVTLLRSELDAIRSELDAHLAECNGAA